MNYYNQQLHDCIYNNKPKAIKYTRTLLVEKDLKIENKTFNDYYREAEHNFYSKQYSRNIRDCRPFTATKLVLSIHLYRMMISEFNSCYFIEHCTADSQYDTIYDRPKMKYRGIEVEINYRNDIEEINLY